MAEARPRLNVKVLKERYEKDDRYFTVYDHYTPNYKTEVVTGKFYSKYDALDLSIADMQIVDDIKKMKDKQPKDRYEWPVTESHRYGWYSKELVPLDRKDNRCYFPLKMSPHTAHEILLRQNKTMQRPKFVGVPFKV